MNHRLVNTKEKSLHVISSTSIDIRCGILRKKKMSKLLTFSLQALLIRHEAYMADAEKERASMTATIDKLETDKKLLEAENAKFVEENRNLLSQLEELNNTVSDSDARVKSLEATLQATSQELQRLSSLASR